MTAVLFTMLAQSMHSFSHLHQLFSEKECHHKYTEQTDISHQHHPFEHCFVCEFTFGAFVYSKFIQIQLHPDLMVTTYLFAKPEIVIAFQEKQSFLRGPPQFIV